MRLRIIGTAALGLSLYLLYLWCRKRYIGQEPENIDDVIKPKKRPGQEDIGPECCICMENTAIIVFVPCNHLVVC